LRSAAPDRGRSYDVTAFKNVQRDDKELILPAINSEVMKEAVEQYLVSPIFRAARYEELVVDDNPYRRPVRPDDIGLVDFSTPLRRSDFSRLSALMGHRMLLNIYDTDRLLLPRHPTPEKWHDYRLFYAETNRFLGDLIRPYLEAHVFGFLADETADQTADETADGAAPTAADLVGRVAELRRKRAAASGRLREVLAASPDRTQMLQMLAIQAVATSLNTGQQPAAALRNLTGSAGLPAMLNGPAGAEVLRRVAEDSGIKYEPHSYYQYYLPSTLALMNYVNRAARDPGRVFALAGALIAQSVETGALQEELAPLLTGTGEPAPESAPGQQLRPASDPDDEVKAIVGLVERVGGDFALRELGRGLAEYGVLLGVLDEDRMRQLTWINAMPSYIDKARRLQTAISENNIEVDLDTFVESWEECSTTHVHDEDRLLVIESGEMEFWNCFGSRHKFKAGDMTFIPKHRLHGSVVLTGECVYHQPVITAELDRQFG